MEIIRPLTSGDAATCAAIVRALPDYFSSDVAAALPAEIASYGGWTALSVDSVVGFLTVDRRSPQAAEIRCLAIAPNARGNGVGNSPTVTHPGTQAGT